MMKEGWGRVLVGLVLCGLVCYGGLGSVTPAQAEVWKTLVDDTRLTSASAWSRYPSLGVDSSDNIHITWEDLRDSNTEIYYTKLDSNGNEWANDDTRLTSDGANSWWPSLGVDNQGNVHIAWYDYRDGNYEIYYTKLYSNGTTAVDDTRLTTAGDSWDPSLGLDNQGNIHIAWGDDRIGSPEIYYTKLYSDGTTAVNDTRLTTAGSGSYDPSLGIDNQGNVHIAWDDYRDGNSEIYYTKLYSDGTTAVGDTRLTSASANSGYPSLGVDNADNIHIAWEDTRNGNYEIYYTKLYSNGITAVDDTRLTSDGTNSRYPSLGVDNQGNVHIAWYDYRDGNAEIYYTKLDGGDGRTVVDDTRLTSDGYASYEPSLGVDSSGNNIHIAWYDYRDGNAEIYYTKGEACELPGMPSSPSPTGGATGVSITTDLDWDDAAEATLYDVYLGTTSPPSTLVCDDTTVSSCDPGTLSGNTTYYWQVVANNACGSTQGSEWNFTTCSLPATPSSLSPADDATNVATTTLDWDDATGATSYDVYFGTTSSPAWVATVTSSIYAPGTLNDNTTYYWQVVANNACGSTSGSEWSFTTCSNPGAFNNLSPSNGALDISTTTTLDWENATGADSYDVYFGTLSPPTTLVCDDTTISSCAPGSLRGNTTYYWQVVANNTCGSASGPEWNFITTCSDTEVCDGVDNNCDGLVDEGIGSIILVPDDYSTIQSAIDAANTNNCDTIVVDTGVYTENINFNGKVITVMGSGTDTIIDGGGAGSVVTFENGEGSYTVLDGFVIKNGSGTDMGGYTIGGGIVVRNGSSPTIINNIIFSNNADLGGGIACDNASSPTITNNTVVDNVATSGGGIACTNNSSPTVTNTILWSNGNDEIYSDGTSSITVTYSDVDGSYIGSGNIDSDPLFMDAANRDYHLQASSPCIDSGIYTDGAPADDIDGDERSEYDIGADEYYVGGGDSDGDDRGSGTGCFIATAAYGTPMAKEVQILCRFRDTYLLSNPLGRKLVALYYKLSPPVARYIKNSPYLKAAVRNMLKPAMWLVQQQNR